MNAVLGLRATMQLQPSDVEVHFDELLDVSVPSSKPLAQPSNRGLA